ncbi:hypothetical protein Tco_0047158 [Tanacetum coccineum]
MCTSTSRVRIFSTAHRSNGWVCGNMLNSVFVRKNGLPLTDIQEQLTGPKMGGKERARIDHKGRKISGVEETESELSATLPIFCEVASSNIDETARVGRARTHYLEQGLASRLTKSLDLPLQMILGDSRAFTPKRLPRRSEFNES